ncbi:S-antigen protein-like [Cloeon dipterum]|uniref:S-antigen protein-like n=1 Tax=Cloeon dipterum TaxID=197152 RepID=UPI00321F8337
MGFRVKPAFVLLALCVVCSLQTTKGKDDGDDEENKGLESGGGKTDNQTPSETNYGSDNTGDYGVYDAEVGGDGSGPSGPGGPGGREGPGGPGGRGGPGGPGGREGPGGRGGPGGREGPGGRGRGGNGGQGSSSEEN